MRRPACTALVGSCLGPLLWGLAGCTSVVPESLRGQVDRSLTYDRLAHQPEAFRGRMVVMGGEVWRVRPMGRDLELTLTERPLSPADDSPMLGRTSGGSLVVLVPGAARAEIREGFVVTVVGVVQGRESAEDPQSPPLLEARDLHVWPVGRAPLPAGREW